MDLLCSSSSLVVDKGFLSRCFVDAVLAPSCLVLACVSASAAAWMGRRKRGRQQGGGRAAMLALLAIAALLPVVEVGVLWLQVALQSNSVLLRAASVSLSAVAITLASVLDRPTPVTMVLTAALFACIVLLFQINLWDSRWLEVGSTAVQMAAWCCCTFAAWYCLETQADVPRPLSDNADRLLLSVQDVAQGPENAVPVMKDSPEENASLFSVIVFGWTSGLMRLGSRFGSRLVLQAVNIWPLIASDRAEAVVARVEQCQSPSVRWTLVRLLGKEFLLSGLFKLINDICVFAGPLLLTLILFFLDTPGWRLWLGCLLAIGLCVSAVMQTLAINAYFFRLYRLGVQSRSALGHMLLRKLFASQRSNKTHSLGALSTLFSVDAARVLDSLAYMHMVWSAPLQIGVSVYLLYGQLGVATFAGLGVIVLLLPFNFLIAKSLGNVQEKLMACKDSRMAKIVEVFQGIRILKYFVWEDLFETAIRDLREVELRRLKTFTVLNSLSSFAWLFAPVLVALVTFSVFAALGHDLTPTIAFSSVALFNVLRFPLNVLPFVVSSLIELRVSLRRMQEFLDSPDRAPYLSAPSDAQLCVELCDATFAWPDAAADALVNVSLSVRRGQICAIVGKVGCGKTSLLAALLGDMELKIGRVALQGSVAFVAQTPWIQNCSLRENILFGLAFDARRYADVVEACQLQADIAMLPSRDRTEIGEKGINLSGGQKQRVALARAVYADKDVYLLDDILSAVDVHVGRAIFDRVLRGVLRGKTIIVVTHQLQYLPDVDLIALIADCRLAEMGSFAELMAGAGQFARLYDEFGHAKEKEEYDKGASVDASSTKKKEAHAQVEKDDEDAGGQLVKKEFRQAGKVEGSVFFAYLSHLGVAAGVFLVTALLLESGGSFASQYWLGVWTSEDSANLVHSSLFWIGIYCCLGGVAAVGSLLAGLIISLGSNRASRALHEAMVGRLIHAPMVFFDQTPTGRILNRCSSDIDQVDEQLPDTL